MPTRELLNQLSSLPLEAKVIATRQRIREWYDHWNGDVYVSFSGGKDSTVLAHMVQEMYGDSIPLVFSNTGLEFPEVQSFCREKNAVFVRPQMRFDEVITRYGYPLVSKEISKIIHIARCNTLNDNNSAREALLGRKMWEDPNTGEMVKSKYNAAKWLPLCTETYFKISDYCCSVMKKRPMKKYEKETGRKPIIATTVFESKLREQKWLQVGCNSFDGEKPRSAPMSFWTEQDVLEYIWQNNVKISDIYGRVMCFDPIDPLQPYTPFKRHPDPLGCTQYKRTGCIFCAFGLHLEKEPTRFQRLAETHPKQYDYCMGGGQWIANPDYDGKLPFEIDGFPIWNPRQIWIPSKEGLGMGKVFDDCNRLYGKDMFMYKDSDNTKIDFDEEDDSYDEYI